MEPVNLPACWGYCGLSPLRTRPAPHDATPPTAQVNARGVTRMHMADGWTSEKTGAGALILEARRRPVALSIARPRTSRTCLTLCLPRAGRRGRLCAHGCCTERSCTARS